jgi:hypothetical protein
MPLPGISLLKKMLIYAVRSRNVYENKGNVDKMTSKRSDIYGNMTQILQKNSGYDGQFSLNDRVSPGDDDAILKKPRAALGGRRHERQCLSHPSPITKGAISSRDVKNVDRTDYMYENTRPW